MVEWVAQTLATWWEVVDEGQPQPGLVEVGGGITWEVELVAVLRVEWL